MPSVGRSSRQLSTRAALTLLGLLAVVALVTWAMSARSAVPVGSAGSAGPAGSVGPAAASTRVSASSSAIEGDGAVRPGSGATVRAKALYVLSVVDSTGSAPAGYVGGRQFMNDTRGGTTTLPRQDTSGRVITYHEYDVNPHVSGVNRGPQRLVIGSDGSAWTTADHYVTWDRLR